MEGHLRDTRGRHEAGFRVFVLFGGRETAGRRRRRGRVVVKGVSRQLYGIGSCMGDRSADRRHGWPMTRTFSEMTPFPCGEVDRIEDEHLGAGSAGQLADGVVEDVFATLDGAVQCKGWLHGRTCRGRVRGTVLGLGVEGDVEIGESVVEQLRRGEHVCARGCIGSPEDIEARRQRGSVVGRRGCGCGCDPLSAGGLVWGGGIWLWGGVGGCEDGVIGVVVDGGVLECESPVHGGRGVELARAGLAGGPCAGESRAGPRRAEDGPDELRRSAHRRRTVQWTSGAHRFFGSHTFPRT